MAEIGKAEDESTRGAPVTVFVSDPSAEAERIAQSLRSSGYVVVDVPLSMLVARVAVQRPKVILVDADGEGAFDAVARVRELSETESIDVVFLGKAGVALSGTDDAFSHEGSGFFTRPVDVEALVRKVDALTGGSSPYRPHHTTPPPSLPASRPPSRPPSGIPSLPPASMRSAEIRPAPRTPPPRTTAVPSLAGSPHDPASLRKSTGAQAPLSGELEALLFEAEQRMGGQLVSESMLPSPEEEIEAVLPAEVLASLDDPLDDDDEDGIVPEALPSHHRGNTTGAGRVTTGAGTGSGTGAGGVTPQPPRSHAPAPKTHGGTNAGTSASTTGATRGSAPRVAVDEPPARDAVPPPAPSVPRATREPSEPPPVIAAPRPAVAPVPQSGPAIAPSVLGPADAPRALATAISGRATGVLAFDGREATRRVVLREGDVVTTASTLDDESLLPFLAARGELPRDRVAQLAGKVPAFGRHAGAALVAHGYMRQDQLWTVLRAHAEWIIGRIVSLDAGSVRMEDETPGRLRQEPSVFGASTGAEVFVEAVRRSVAPKAAIDRLGGQSSRVVEGPNAQLAGECALGAAETAWLGKVRGKTIGEALATAGDPDFAAVLYALVALGVCEAIRAATGARAVSDKPPAADPLDDEAIRARVRARMQLVDEGDYFAVLGVSREATSYEVRRAFLELRRTFEASKLLTPSLSDLVDDVRKIASVLDEAYEILRDVGRRERYRRAIEAVPR